MTEVSLNTPDLHALLVASGIHTKDACAKAAKIQPATLTRIMQGMVPPPRDMRRLASALTKASKLIGGADVTVAMVKSAITESHRRRMLL